MAFAVRRLARVLAVVVVGSALVAPSAARAAESAFATAEVAANTYFPQLEHNVADVVGTLSDGASFAASFLQNFEQTGGVERWGYPTSAIFEETPGTLTQYYQRGVIDWRPPPSGEAHTFLRRLAWDYVGGGLGGSEDQGVELGLTNPNPGDEFGPWGHKVANVSVEGVDIGFADFFHRLGGVASFGFPKTDARRDDHPQAVLHDPTRLVDGRIRQYFQAAVLEYHPESSHAPVKLGLLGDTLRNTRYPGDAWRRYAVFGSEAPFAVGERIETKLERRRGTHGSTVEDVADFLQVSLLRVNTDVGCGTGFFVTESGYAVTTWNLVRNARIIQVSGPGGRDEGALLIAGDAYLNIALIRVPGDDHIPVIWGDSNGLDAQVELVTLGYEAERMARAGAIGCQAEPTSATTSLSGVNSNRWLGVQPGINVGQMGGPVALRTGHVVGVLTPRYPVNGGIADLVPAASAQPVVESWIDEVSRGGTPTLPHRPRFDPDVLAERDWEPCPGTPGPDGTITVRGAKIEFTATVQLSPYKVPVGLIQFRDAYSPELGNRDLVYFGPLGTASGGISMLTWLRDSVGSYSRLREGGHEDIVIGGSFHIRFVYDSSSVALYINGQAAHLESGLPYGDYIWFQVECLASTGSPDMFYHNLRITGIAPPENW
ncbi:MAG: serine protease [Chloroflexi bacterium]|nr:serine protease [Chloroflexota bacterium]